MNELVTKDGEVVNQLPEGYNEGNQSIAVLMARAEVDQQIATARTFPRSIQRSVGAIKSLATLDETSAQESIYALPRGGKPIKGPSIRLAEIIASQWGNCRAGARVVHIDRVEKYVEAEGVFHDLETNSATTQRVRRRISDKKGNLLNDDMIIVTGNAACSIAKRNAILAGVPKAVWRAAYEAVEKVIAGDIKTLAVRRTEAFKAFAFYGVKPEQIYAALGVQGEADITLEHLTTLIGMHSSLKSGEETVESLFATDRPDGPVPPRPKKEEPKNSDAQPAAEKSDAKAPEAQSGSNQKPASGANAEAEKQAAADTQKASETKSPQQMASDIGRQHASEGRKLRAMPPEYQSSEELRNAYTDGWEAFFAEQKVDG